MNNCTRPTFCKVAKNDLKLPDLMEPRQAITRGMRLIPYPIYYWYGWEQKED
jgi:hypothetical protein